MNYKIAPFVEPHYPIKKTLLRRAAEATLSTIKVKGKVEITISVIGDRKMRGLNREYCRVDEPTDVLAFPYSLQTGKPKEFITPPSKYLNLGDVIISYPQLIERAAKEDTLVDDMAKMLVVHGCLHLLGYEHEKPQDAQVMESLEDQILSSLS
ncbi:MAG: rRNA maturation RNase YbeY [Candidatus Woykebacteria bacterium GWB1_45_5]|uniref:Endoribonuclease YbeY n=2 Tax=Candidatus Woykeibacteriota TaxID=1817899 RepID=A0A1G1W348_9BACT|nr:MAG: rRNA maturation RNase YbeY [Candidatus Woykebacteria bacterium GWA1_44_8]OGY22644.1 MAG: rRNA maturation RNase YbeY [Candidatus Woykebacteria bacterium GWB1_45_5]